jgi:hypothetical protein
MFQLSTSSTHHLSSGIASTPCRVREESNLESTKSQDLSDNLFLPNINIKSALHVEDPRPELSILR